MTCNTLDLTLGTEYPVQWDNCSVEGTQSEQMVESSFVTPADQTSDK